jgi:prepilin-type N-terminal cleavage/methylation domain-containing protein
MKRLVPFSSSARSRSSKPVQGFTLPEILIAMTVFMLVVAGVVYANLFGLKMFQINQGKLMEVEWSRSTFGKITDEVHTCNNVLIGNGTNGGYTGLLDGEAQQGSSLLIYPTTDTNTYIFYYFNPSDQTFRRTTQVPDSTVILAESVTNSIIFSAQDFSGNVLTNKENNRVIHLKLEFVQPDRFLLGPDYYKLETSMTRRALN